MTMRAPLTKEELIEKRNEISRSITDFFNLRPLNLLEVAEFFANLEYHCIHTIFKSILSYSVPEELPATRENMVLYYCFFIEKVKTKLQNELKKEFLDNKKDEEA